MGRLAFAMAVLASALAGLGAGALLSGLSSDRSFERQQKLVLNRAIDTQPGGVVVFGDSIVERQNFTTLCGLLVFNAGISSAKLSDIEPVVDGVLERTGPARAVVAIGPNDFLVEDPTGLADFSARLDQLLARLPPRAIVFGMTPKPAYPTGEEANAAIRATARKHGAVYVEAVPPAMTQDGLHLNRAGLREWKRRVQAAC